MSDPTNTADQVGMSDPTNTADQVGSILDEDIRRWQRLRDWAIEKDPLDREVIAEELRKWDRMRELAAHSEPSTAELIQRARETDDPDIGWDYVMILHYRGTHEVLEAARSLCADTEPAARSLGADILGQLGAGTHPFPIEAGDILLPLLATETHPEVLRDIADAFSQMQDERATEPLLRLQSHAAPEVRFGVARGLGGVEDPRASAALITLSRDPDPDVREWATFGLGLQVAHDENNASPAMRQALWARVADEDDDTREEALLALAELRDDRVVAPLIEELHRGAFTTRLLGAVAALADPRFCAGLQAVRAWWPDAAEVARALSACGCATVNAGSPPH